MTEQWKAVPGYEGWYEVSDHGRVRSLDRWVHQTNQSGPYRRRLKVTHCGPAGSAKYVEQNCSSLMTACGFPPPKHRNESERVVRLGFLVDADDLEPGAVVSRRTPSSSSNTACGAWRTRAASTGPSAVRANKPRRMSLMQAREPGGAA